MILTPEQPTLARHARNAAESAHPELWRGLVGAWVPALGYQGRTLYDASPNNRNGDIQGATWESPESLLFTGNDKVIFVPDWVTLFPPYTLSATFRIDNIGTDGAIIGDFKFTGWMLWYDSDTPSVAFITELGGGILVKIGESPQTVTAGQWHTCHLVADSTSTTMYVDGKIADSATNSLQLPEKASRGVSIGTENATTTDRGLDGAIREVSVRRVALTAKQVSTLNRDPLAPFRLRDDTALVTSAMFGGTPSVTLPQPLLNMQMTGSF